MQITTPRRFIRTLTLTLVLLLVVNYSAYAEKVLFQVPYHGEKSMNLLIEYGFGDFEMKLANDNWSIEIDLPVGRYNYVYSTNPLTQDNWFPFDSWKNWKNPVIYVGYKKVETNHFVTYFIKETPPKYITTITRLLETIYQGMKEEYRIDLIKRRGEGRKIEIRIDTNWGYGANFLAQGYVWLQFSSEQSFTAPSKGGNEFNVYCEWQ
jgi:hypothetical protein